MATAEAEVAATISPVPPTPTAAVTLPPAIITPQATEAPPTPEVTPTPDTVVLAAEAAAFAGRNPLTGEKVADPESLNRRPITVKLSNAPADYTRPQAGLNDADIIFGGTMRYMLTFKMLEARPVFTAYVERLEQRPALQRSIVRNAAVAAEHGLKFG